jgi:hypothetical protein
MTAGTRVFLVGLIMMVIFLSGTGFVLGGEEEVIIFKQELMPQLMQFAEAENIQVLDGETREDFMAAAYNLARWRGRIPFGQWNGQVVEELRFVSAFLCALPWWPKDDEIKAAYRTIRRQITFNAYNQTIVKLSIEDAFFEYSHQEIRRFNDKQALTDIRALMNIPLVTDSLINP